jgi:hypothetical protein
MVESIETRRDNFAVRGIDKRVVTETTNERGEIPSIDRNELAFVEGTANNIMAFESLAMLKVVAQLNRSSSSE